MVFRMVFRINSLFVKTMLFVSNPHQRLPRLLPIGFEHVRVGSNATEYVRLVWR